MLLVIHLSVIILKRLKSLAGKGRDTKVNRVSLDCSIYFLHVHVYVAMLSI